MAKRNPVLLEAGIFVLVVGFGLFLNPFHNEPLWAQWLIGPVMIYLALPTSMVAAAVYFFRTFAQPCSAERLTKTPELNDCIAMSVESFVAQPSTSPTGEAK